MLSRKHAKSVVIPPTTRMHEGRTTKIPSSKPASGKSLTFVSASAHVGELQDSPGSLHEHNNHDIMTATRKHPLATHSLSLSRSLSLSLFLSAGLRGHSVTLRPSARPTTPSLSLSHETRGQCRHPNHCLQQRMTFTLPAGKTLVLPTPVEFLAATHFRVMVEPTASKYPERKPQTQTKALMRAIRTRASTPRPSSAMYQPLNPQPLGSSNRFSASCCVQCKDAKQATGPNTFASPRNSKWA